MSAIVSINVPSHLNIDEEYMVKRVALIVAGTADHIFKKDNGGWALDSRGNDWFVHKKDVSAKVTTYDVSYRYGGGHRSPNFMEAFRIVIVHVLGLVPWNEIP